MENLSETFYLSMILIGVGSFLFGILPVAFSFRETRSCPFFLSLILCLGAGVLLATSLVHMLTEVQEELKSNAQLYFCAGFLALYTFDEISHYCMGIKKPEVRSVAQNCEQSHSKRNDYGAAAAAAAHPSSSEKSPLLQTTQDRGFEGFPGEKSFESSQTHFSARNEEVGKREPQQSLLDVYLNSDNDEPTETTCEVNTIEPWSPNSAAKTGLLIALFIHSILEGVSIGVQTKTSQVLLILGAVTFHKLVLSFCLGLELRGSKTVHLLIAIFVFSIGSPLGILLGMSVTSFEKGVFGLDSELQAVAAGSLLYVATFEVLPRERIRWQHDNTRKGAGIFQLIFVLLGFSCITAFHLFLSYPEHGGNNVANSTRKPS